MAQLNDLSVRELATAIQTKAVSSREVVEFYIKQINSVNPELNAVVQLCEETAMAQAEAADDLLANGDLMGPLHGVPMTIKDSLDTAGVISTGGTLGRSHHIPQHDATVVARLRGAGAILLGKTNTSELTLSYKADNLIYGQTNNPHNVSVTPGGSSGGAAAIVAAGGSPFDIGSDYGGSLRYPAHCCGVTTIKPTSGRVPRTGHIIPPGGLLDSFQQIGPIARHVDDLNLLLPIISGPDGVDPSIVPMPPGDPGAIDVTQLRIAFHADNGIVSASAETQQVVLDAATLLHDDGMIAEDIRPSGIEKTHAIAMGLWAADGGAMIRRLLTDAGTTEHSIPWLEGAKALDAIGLDALILKWDAYRSSLLSIFNDHDVILCPVNAFPALAHGVTGKDLRAFSYTSAYNLTGWPAAVVRGGTSPNGLPIGLQIIAKPWREDVALAMAGYFENAFGTFPHPPVWSP